MAKVLVEFTIPDSVTMDDDELFSYLEWAIAEDWSYGDVDEDIEITWIKE